MNDLSSFLLEIRTGIWGYISDNDKQGVLIKLDDVMNELSLSFNCLSTYYANIGKLNNEYSEYNAEIEKYNSLVSEIRRFYSSNKLLVFLSIYHKVESEISACLNNISSIIDDIGNNNNSFDYYILDFIIKLKADVDGYSNSFNSFKDKFYLELQNKAINCDNDSFFERWYNELDKIYVSLRGIGNLLRNFPCFSYFSDNNSILLDCKIQDFSEGDNDDLRSNFLKQMVPEVQFLIDKYKEKLNQGLSLTEEESLEFYVQSNRLKGKFIGNIVSIFEAYGYYSDDQEVKFLRDFLDTVVFSTINFYPFVESYDFYCTPYCYEIVNTLNSNVSKMYDSKFIKWDNVRSPIGEQRDRRLGYNYFEQCYNRILNKYYADSRNGNWILKTAALNILYGYFVKKKYTYRSGLREFSENFSMRGFTAADKFVELGYIPSWSKYFGCRDDYQHVYECEKINKTAINEALIQLYFQFLQIDYLFTCIYEPPCVESNKNFSDILQDGTGGPKK